MDGILNAANVASLACVVGLVLVLGGCIAIMLYGVRGLVDGARQWVDRK